MQPKFSRNVELRSSCDFPNQYSPVIAKVFHVDKQTVAIFPRLSSGIEAAVAEVPRVLFLGLCLVFHYFSTGVVFPKIGFYFSRRAVAQALVEP
ncbi:hypothetical protein ACOI9U_13195, partial [Corynebacterium striatum]|uniref:hypothetical protein n=1 Tax=Corynebacterium striatum TaxID=43770 RepID=UPI003B63D89C